MRGVAAKLTKHHHGLIKQFIAFKNRTEANKPLFEDMKEKINLLEIALAQKYPVMEAEHAFDDTNPLSTFDCLIPKLKEHRRFKLLTDDTTTIADFATQ